MRLMLLLSAALASGTAVAGETETAEAITQVAHQHTAIAVLSAMHYCSTRAWPRSLADVKAGWNERDLPLPVKPDWALLASEGVTFEVADALVLSTPARLIPHALKVTTTNRPPGCAGGDLDVRAHMHVGEYPVAA